MSTTLYDLAVEYKAITDAIQENGGELTPEIEDALDDINAPLEAKLDAIAAIVREFEAREMARKREAAHHAKKASVNGNAARRLKEYAKACMQVADIESHKGRFDVAIWKNPLSAKWTGDPDKIPDGFRRERTEVSFDGAAALAAFKRGETLPENVVISRGSHLRIS